MASTTLFALVDLARGARCKVGRKNTAALLKVELKQLDLTSANSLQQIDLKTVTLVGAVDS